MAILTLLMSIHFKYVEENKDLKTVLNREAEILEIF